MSRPLAWNVSVVTPPTATPVSLDDVRKQGRIEVDVDDDRLLGMLNGVIGELDSKDGWLGRALITQTLRLTMDRFPARRVNLPLPPLQSVSSVKFLDDNEQEQTVSPSLYRVVTSATPGRIELQSGNMWPVTGSFSDAVRIEYVAGYGDANAVPSPIREWLIATTADRYEQRTPTIVGTISSRLKFVDRMLDSYVVRAIPGP